MSLSVRSLSAAWSSTVGLPLVIVAGVLWGTGGIAGSTLQRDGQLTAAAIGFWRLGAAAVLLLAWHAATRSLDRLVVDARTMRTLAGNGVLLAAFQACYFTAVPSLGVAVATLVTLGSAPVMVAIAHGVRESALPGWRTRSALVLAVLGLAGVAADDGSVGTGKDAALGIVWCLASAGGFAALTLRQQRLQAPCSAMVSVTVAFGVGALVLLPIAMVGGAVLPAPGARSVALVVYLGLLPTALAYGAYFAGLGRVSATTAAVAAMLEPITAGALSLVLLGERLGPLAIAGSVTVVAAIALGAERRPMVGPSANDVRRPRSRLRRGR